MNTTKLSWKSFAAIPKTYEALCRVYLPRPIHDKIDLENATEIVDFLAGHKLNTDQEDYLDLLSDLVSEYEEDHATLKPHEFSGAQVTLPIFPAFWTRTGLWEQKFFAANAASRSAT